MLRLLRSSTFRLVLLYMGLVGSSVLVLLGFIYWNTAGYMDRQTDVTIQADIKGLADQYRLRGLTGLTAVIARRVARDPGGANIYLLADDDYTPIVGNLSGWPDAVPDKDGWFSFRLREWGPEKAEEHQARARGFSLRGGLHLLVGRDVRDLEAIRRLILEALAWGLAITFALALGGGLMMTWSVVRRLEAINETSREIMEGDLSRRIDTDGSGDDFDQLAGNLNLMLERIAGLMESVRQVSDNIAHDLRTPLTRLRAQLELAKTQFERPEAARLAVQRAIEDANELLATFNALLRIARIESGGQRAGFTEVDISTLVRDVAEFYEPLVADKGQQLTVDVVDGMRVNGDRDLLFQAIANLVDNAIKYTPRSGRVTLGGRKLADKLEVSVTDTGPGIPAGLRNKVFERFFRLDSSRSTPGSGLGLSLVQAVAQLHGLPMGLEDNRPGLCVRLWFPRPRSRDAAKRGAAPKPVDFPRMTPRLTG